MPKRLILTRQALLGALPWGAVVAAVVIPALVIADALPDRLLLAAVGLVGLLLVARLWAALAAERSHRLAHARERDRLAAVVNAAVAIAAAAPAVGRTAAEAEFFGEDGSVVAVATHAVSTIADAGLSQTPAAMRAITTGAPTEQTPDEPGTPPERANILRAAGKVRVLVVPLLAEGSVVGCLTLWTPGDDRPFTTADLGAARAVGHQAGLAIHRARLLAETRAHAEEQRALLRLAQGVGAQPSLGTALAEVTRTPLDLDLAEDCALERWHLEADETEVVARTTNPDWLTSLRIAGRQPLAAWPIARRVLAERIPVVCGLDSADLQFEERRRLAAAGASSALLVPVLSGAACAGLLALYSRRPNAFPPRVVDFARELAAQAGAAIERDRLQAALQSRADTDGLTGLLNHRAILEVLDHELARTSRSGAPVGLLLVDLDGFKLFNDAYGHPVGDEVLRQTASLLRGCVRATDRVGRYGGDEFLLVLPDADAAEAREVADRIMTRAKSAAIAVGGQRLPLALAVGLAAAPGDGVLRRELLGAADAAMYAAKTSGGGRVSERGPETDQLGPSAYGALKGLVRAVDQKDRYTKAHSDQVASLAVALGRELGLPEPQLEALDMAGRLHDVGKIAVPDGILRKPGRLTDAERFAVEQHALFSVQMIQGVPHQDVVTAAVAHHHERWDGEGYPYGKRGEEIPLAGRILALADAFSAMTTDRPYRKGEAPAAAIAKIRTGAGTQFDPALIEPFVRALENLGEPLAATVAISQPDHPEESPAVAPMATRSRRRRRDFRPWPATSRRSVSLLRWRTKLHSGANRVASPVRMPKYATQRPPTPAADAVLSVQDPRPDLSPEHWSAIPDDVGAAQRP
ncbi:MAG: hypothetical protein QOF33_3015 [Thermomicrobiales bacterium]|nr:hypothetical protein [Thermomicrobiales bacterium]